MKIMLEEKTVILDYGESQPEKNRLEMENDGLDFESRFIEAHFIGLDWKQEVGIICFNEENNKKSAEIHQG
jgi:hypothetical protein